MKARVHKGYQETYGYYFDLRHVSEAQAKARIVARWQPGVRVLQYPTAYFVVFEHASLQDTRFAPGYPLTKVENCYTSVAATPQQLESYLESLNTTSRVGFLVYGQGQLEFFELQSAQLVDPSDWLDVSNWREQDCNTLGRIPAAPKNSEVNQERPIHKIFANENLKGSPEKEAFLNSIRDKKEFNFADGESRGSFSRFFDWFKPSKKTPDSSRNGVSHGFPSPQTSSLGERISSFFTRAILTSKLAKVIAKRQAKYFRKMLEMFDSGDLGEALRHAVPLQNTRDMFEGSSQPALGTFTPRSNLDIQLQQSRSGRNFSFQDEFFNHIKQLYRRTFEKLDRAGNFKEAAFVLAELLQEAEEAVNYLEKKGQLQLAAELAEGRKVSPGIVVRQWILAGDIDRAVNVAITTGAFSQAYNLLYRTHPVEASQLKLIWANKLAQAGQYGAAVDVLWESGEHQQLVLQWIDAAIEEGGEIAARMLARKLTLADIDYDSVRDRVLQLMRDDDQSYDERIYHALNRLSFATTLDKSKSVSDAIKAMSRVTARALIRDYNNGLLKENKSLVVQLLSFSQQRAMLTDLPFIESKTATPMPDLRSLTPPKVYKFDNTGTSAVYDVLPVANNRFLVALGEGGSCLLNRKGRLIRHFSLPAYKLVGSDQMNRVITVAPRGDIYRLARLDLSNFREKYWCEIQLDGFSDSYDGFYWCVFNGNEVMAIDAQSDELKSLWRISDLPGRVVDISRSQRSLGVLLQSRGFWEAWRYELPGFMLRQRTVLNTNTLNPEFLRAVVINSEAQTIFLANPASEAELESGHLYELTVVGFKQENPSLMNVDCPLGRFAKLHYHGGWLVIPVNAADGMRALVLDIDMNNLSRGKTRLYIFVPSTPLVEFRIVNEELLLFDRLGQIQLISLKNGDVMWQHSY